MVADEQYRSASTAHAPHLAEQSLLKTGATHRQHLVNQQDLRFEKRRHCKRQAQVHAGGIALHRGVNKPFDFSEGDRKSTRLNSSHGYISYAVFCLKKKKKKIERDPDNWIVT